MTEFACPRCGTAWPTNYCPTCASTIDRSRLAARSASETMESATGAPVAPAGPSRGRGFSAAEAARPTRREHEENPYAAPRAGGGRAENTPGGFPVAGVGRRVAAYVVDIVPITLAVSAVFYFFFGFDETLSNYFSNLGDHEARARFLLERNRVRDLSFIVWVIYGAILEASTLHGTLGKKLLGIHVVDGSGTPLTFKRSLGRNAAKLLSYLPLALGFIWIVFSKKRQGWHDRLAKTQVVRTIRP